MTFTWDDSLVGRVKDAAFRGIVAGAERVKSVAVKKILSGPKTGRPYRRRGVVHIASAPGEPPANDVGRLAKSIRTDHNKETLSSKVIASTEYALDLEVGNEKMEARPYMRPSLNESGKFIADAVRGQIEKELNSGSVS